MANVRLSPSVFGEASANGLAPSANTGFAALTAGKRSASLAFHQEEGMPRPQGRTQSRHAPKGCLLLSCALWSLACNREPVRIRAFPHRVLWAWESSQDLRFLTNGEGVAFLGGELHIEGADLHYQPRRNALRVNRGTPLMAVLRVEAKGSALTAAQAQGLVDRALQLTQLPQVRALQIDFDAAVSQRAFYAEALKSLRGKLPAEMPLSITALASWCLDDLWIEEAGLVGVVDEAVPMLFRMGAEGAQVRSRLARREAWHLALARHSYGVSADEPLPALRSGRRVYVFHSGPWRPEDEARVFQDLP